MSNTFTLLIITPEKEIFNGEAEKISFTTDGGDLQIMPDHASITATISFSPTIILLSLIHI